MKEETYVTYEQSRKLKDLGFDYKCRHYYYIVSVPTLERDRSKYNRNLDWNKSSAPRIEQAQKWLRKVKGIHISVNPYMAYDINADGKPYNELPSWAFELMDVATASFMNKGGGKYETFETALLAGIDAALKIAEEKMREQEIKTL